MLVETTEGEWGYIYDDAYTFREALLICRYAGYRNYLEYRNVVEDDLDRMRKSNDVMGMMFNPLIMLDNLDCSEAGIH